MFRKPFTLQLLLLVVLLSTFPNASLLAQKENSSKGKLFLIEQRPRDEQAVLTNTRIHLPFRTYDSCGLAAMIECSSVAGKTRYVRKVNTMVLTKTSAPQATCATVIPTIGFSGCGSCGDTRRVM